MYWCTDRREHAVAMNYRHPTERMTEDEIARIREMARQKPAATLAKELRLNEVTVLRVIAGEAVHRTTAEVVRGYLDRGPSRRGL